VVTFGERDHGLLERRPTSLVPALTPEERALRLARVTSNSFSTARLISILFASPTTLNVYVLLSSICRVDFSLTTGCTRI
jgi:hypothetical protein